mgnify:CR=1 FL=1
MTDPALIDTVICSIEDANLPAPHYRTARRLLDLVDDGGQVKISRRAMMDLCQTDAEGTMRSHLGALKAAGLIHFSTNAAVYVAFLAFPTVDGMLAERASTRDLPAPTRVLPVQEPCDAPENGDVVLVERAPTRDLPASTRVQRAPPHTRVRSFVRSDPTTLLGDQKRTNEHAGTEPLSAEQVRAVALLTDVDVGLDAPTARRLAARHRFEELLRHVLTWRRELAAGKVVGTGALLTRIHRRFSAQLVDGDRDSDLWRRHVGVEDTQEERRQKYIPDEYRDIILGA